MVNKAVNGGALLTTPATIDRRWSMLYTHRERLCKYLATTVCPSAFQCRPTIVACWSHLTSSCVYSSIVDWAWDSSSQHMVISLTLNPYMSLFNLKLCTHIWSTNINFRSPPYIGLFSSVFVWTFTLWVNCGGSIGHRTRFFVTDRNVTT